MMPLLPAFWLATMATLPQQAVLRGGCSAEESEIAVLAAGTAVEIRSALSGDSGTCYKVAAQSNGQAVLGYLPASAVAAGSATGSFDAARRAAKPLGAGGGSGTATTAATATVVAKAAAKSGREHPAAKAMELIQANQPEEALRLIERDLQRYPMDPALHAVAGLAFYRTDNLDRAILHWKESLAIEAEPNVQALLDRALREKAADGGSERMVGNRVILRYERASVAEPLAQAMLQVLDEEYTRVSFALGCRANERVTAVAQSRDAYMRSTQAAEWSVGMYDGRIHVPVAASRQVPPELRRTFAHELVHACLHELGPWPSWLHEGLAQKYSGQTLAPGYRGAIEAKIQARELPPLSKLAQGWGGLSSQGAMVAYTYALFAADRLIEMHANTGIAHILRDPAGFAQVERQLEAALGFK